jgi:hypothetical protein
VIGVWAERGRNPSLEPVLLLEQPAGTICVDTLDKKSFCPVCGYRLEDPLWQEDSPSDEICPSCGTQFGYDDEAGGDLAKRQAIYRSRRNAWVDHGMKWYSRGISRPPNWNPVEQLRLAGLVDDE